MGTDEVAGYIDLSKRRVSPEDIVKCEERYNKGKMVHSIMRHVAEKTHNPIESLYESIAWPLNKKFGHAIDAFKLSITLVGYIPRCWITANIAKQPRGLERHHLPQPACRR